MKTTIHLRKGLLTTSQKNSLIEYTPLNESHFKRGCFRGWRCNEELPQEGMDLEKVVKLSRHFGVEFTDEVIYLGGWGW